MKFEDRDEYVDRVAQAVIDRIEERDTINNLVNMVVARVIELQNESKEEAALLQARAMADSPHLPKKD